jgi:hypothetical protein
MTQTNAAGLEIVFRNPEARRGVQCSSTWLLYARDHEDFRVLVTCDGASRPRIVRKEAA